jgi:hypothetical protein
VGEVTSWHSKKFGTSGFPMPQPRRCVLTSRWHAVNEQEWCWQVEFYNHLLLSKASRVSPGIPRAESLLLARAAPTERCTEFGCRGAIGRCPDRCAWRPVRLHARVFRLLRVPPSAARVRKSQLYRHLSLKVTQDAQALDRTVVLGTAAGREEYPGLLQSRAALRPEEAATR